MSANASSCRTRRRFRRVEFQHRQEGGHERAQADGRGEKLGKDEPRLGLQPGEQHLHLVGHGDMLIVDLADDQLFGEPPQHDVERVPQLDAVRVSGAAGRPAGESGET